MKFKNIAKENYLNTSLIHINILSRTDSQFIYVSSLVSSTSPTLILSNVTMYIVRCDIFCQLKKNKENKIIILNLNYNCKSTVITSQYATLSLLRVIYATLSNLTLLHNDKFLYYFYLIW